MKSCRILNTKTAHAIKLCLAIFFILLSATACVTTSGNIKKADKERAKGIQTIKIERFSCEDPYLAESILANMQSQFLKARNVSLVEGDADAIVRGVITISNANVGGVAGTGGMLYGSEVGGRYITGITAKIFMGEKLISIASVSQELDGEGIQAGESMSRTLAKKIMRLLNVR